MCLFKLKTQENKNKYKFLKNYAGIDPKYPQTIGSTREKDVEIQGPVRPETDLSPFRIYQCSSHRPQSVVHWDRAFVEFSMTEKCKFPICWNNSDQKTKLVLWSWSGYLCNFLWKGVQHKSSKVSEIMAQHLATMWHWSPASVRWPWFYGEAWKLKTPIVMLQG